MVVPITIDLNRFIRNLTLKHYYNIKPTKAQPENETDPTHSNNLHISFDDLDLEGLAKLQELYSDNGHDDLSLLSQYLLSSLLIKQKFFRQQSVF